MEIAAWCSGSQIESEHCVGDEVCGWDLPNDEVACVGVGCGGVTAAGECRVVGGVSFALWCDGDGYPRAERCMAFETCGTDAVLGRVTCLDVPPDCTHDCSTGETGCATDNAQVWTCGEAGDGDDCLDRIYTACDAGETCVDGACTCADECAAGETGCVDSTARWACGEAGDGDDCLERRISSCSPGSVCDGGQCVCQDECAAGESGCADDFLGEWTCGEADDGDTCLERVHVDCAAGEVCRENGCEPEQRPLSPGGCACHTGRPASDPAVPLVLLLVLGLGWVRRRRV